MKIKSFLLVILLLCISLGLNQSCRKEECRKSLADLITEVRIQSSVSIKVGQIVKIPNIIENVLGAVNDCVVAASESSSRIIMDLDVSNNGSFSKNIINNNFDVPMIDAGKEVEENYEVQFNDPGEYRLMTICDDKKQVAERNETNNESPNVKLMPKNAGSKLTGIIITVLPNPNFKKRPGAPEVEILTRSVRFIN